MLPNDGGDDDDISDADQDSEAMPANKTSDDMLLASQTSGSSMTSKGSMVDRNEVAGSKRHTGDLHIYVYYMRSVGWWTSMTYVVAITAFVFCISFPSK
jgi:hypothetical protein